MNILNTESTEVSGSEPVLRGALGLAIISLGVCGFLYSSAATGLGQLLFPVQANGSQIVLEGKTVGSALVAQPFQGLAYFHPRPSASGYDPMAAASSNMARTNPELNSNIQQRLQEQSQINGVAVAEVPKDLVTASGSGMDPEISLASAQIQVQRIAQKRGVKAQDIQQLLQENVKTPVAGVLGQSRVNVLLLNIRLDQKFGKTVQ